MPSLNAYQFSTHCYQINASKVLVFLFSCVKHNFIIFRIKVNSCNIINYFFNLCYNLVLVNKNDDVKYYR